MTSTIDTPFTYNPTPYNLQDKNNYINRNGLLPSYQYKKNKIIWLNTNYATSSINNGSTTYFEFTFNIPDFTLYNQTKLRVVSFVANENTAKPLIIKLRNLIFDTRSTINSDNEGSPILYVSHAGSTGFLNNDKYCLSLLAQNINNIVIKVDDSFIDKDTGFTISNAGVGHFIMALLFEDEDLIIDNVASQYK